MQVYPGIFKTSLMSPCCHLSQSLLFCLNVKKIVPRFERATMSTYQGTLMINYVKNVRALLLYLKHMILNVSDQHRF